MGHKLNPISFHVRRRKSQRYQTQPVTYKYYLNDALNKRIPFYTAGKAGVGGGWWWKENTPDLFKMHNICYSFLR